jgi:hypothetical protein
MERFIKIEIITDDIISKYCGKECTFLDDFYDTCQLFGDLSDEKDKDVYLRCKSCLEQEIKNDKY